jgi:hypothetical protein
MGKTVDEYVKGLEDWQAEIISNLRDLVLEAAPKAIEVFKWNQPVYEWNGPFVYIKAFKNHINFGFWRGVDLPDPEGVLSGTGKKMRHIQLRAVEDIDRDQLQRFVRSALELNDLKGDSSRGE